MIFREAMRPSTARGTRVHVGWAALTVALLSGGCQGENLFSLSAIASVLGPQVDISAPQADATVAVGASVLVTASVTSSVG